jgi:hypothetical protein
VKAERALSVLLAAIGSAALVRGGSGCSSEPAAAAADAGVDTAVVDARVDRGLPELDAAHESPFEGWEHFADYDPFCEFYIPKARENLPPPIRWETCRANPETSGRACRQMVLDWQPSTLINELITPGTRALRRPNGDVVLMTARFQSDGVFRITAEVDGPVLTAVREQKSTRCVLGEEKSDGDHYAYRVLDSEAKGELSEYGGGAIGGRLDELRPKVLRHYHDSFTRGFIAGDPGLVEVSGGLMSLLSWNDGSLVKDVWSSSQDNGLAQNYQFFYGSTLFWASDNEAINKQKVYTTTGGVKDLITYGDDFTKGVADLGTDGQQLVWIEGLNRPEPNGVFPDITAYVAPFTTDPAQIVKRALRSDLSGYPFGTSPFVVGCGYAARATEMKRDGGFENGTLLIRLSDGYAWHLHDGPGVDWGWRTPLALTCDELFVKVVERPTPGATPRWNVVRVRIDSLGSPTPP